MLILLVAAVTTPVTAADPTPASPTRVACRPGANRATAPGRASVRKLGEMPPGQQIKAVWRFDADGCPSPVVVRREVGANGR